MINNKKGKEHMPRPLKVRIIAFLTALAMVFSVIYFGNRSKSVEATTPTVTLSDESFLKNNASALHIMGYSSFDIYVPASGITFTTPDDEGGSRFEGDPFPVYENGGKYYLDATLAGEGAVEHSGGWAYDLKFCSNSDGTGDKPDTITSATADQVLYLCKVNRGYTIDGNIMRITVEDGGTLPAAEVVCTLSLKTYDPEITFDASSDPASVSGTEPTGSETEIYYGTTEYTVTKDSETPTSYTSLSEINAAINKIDADGTYSIQKTITAPASGGSTVIYDDTKTGTVNNYLLTGYKADYTVDSTATVTGDLSLKPNYAITVPATDTVSAKASIEVTFTTDVALDPATDAISVDSSIGAAPSVTKDASSNTYTFDVSGAAEDINGTSPVYTVTLKDSLNKTETFTVTVYYSDGKPVFSDEKVNSDLVSASYIPVKDASTSIGATVSIQDEKASLGDVEVFRIDGSSIPSGATSDEKATVSGTSVSYDVSNLIKPGKNTFAMRAYSKYGETGNALSGDSALFKVFYDNVNPYIKENTVAISQGSTSATVTHEAGTKNYEATVTATSDTDIEFYVDDLQEDGGEADKPGSGINTVSVKNGTSSSTVTPGADGKCTYKVTKDTSKADGKTDDLEVYINDNAGNEDTYHIALKYINENANISDGSFSPDVVGGGNNFFKWDSATKEATVTYKIETNVELETQANDGVIITVDGKPVTVSQDEVKAVTSTGSYKYQYEVTYTYPSTTHKDYDIKVTVKNKNGYVSPVHTTELRSVDITDPTIDVDNMDSTWHQNLVLLVSVDDGAISSGFDYADATGVDSAKYTTNPFNAIVNKSTSTSGTPVTFKAYDNAGNESAEFSHTYYIDQDKPRLTLKVGGKDYTEVDGKVISVADPVINYTAVDDLSGLTGGYTFKIDGNTYPAPISQDKKLSEIVGSVDPAHAYKIELSATDHVGNSETYTTTFKADGAKPEIDGKIETQPKKAKYPTCFNENVTLTVTVTDSNILQKDIKVEDTEGHTLKTEWKDEGNGKFTGTIKATSEGKYNVKVTATDQGGLSSTWTKAFIIDKTAPDVTTQLNGSNYTASNSYNTTVTTGVVVNDTNEDPSDVVVTMLRDKPEGGQETINKTGKGPFTVSDDGFYKVTYVVTDKAGNKTTKEIGFTVDNTAPVNNLYVLTDNPSKVDSYHNNYVNVHNVFTEHSNQENYAYGQYYNTDVTVEINYFDYNLNSVYVTDRGTELSPTWTEKNGYGKATITLSSEGYHEIKIWTDDLAGNSADDTEVGQKIRFTIDKTSPVISTTLNGAGYAEGSGVRYLTTNGTVGVTVSDTNVDEKDLKRIYRITPPGGATRTGEDYVSPGSETYQEEADYQVQYVAVDKAGNSSFVRTVEFRVDKTAPQLSISSVGATSTAGSVSISFNVKEAFYWDMNSVTIKIYKKKDGSGETLEKTIDMKPKSSNDSTSYTFTEDAEYRIEFTAEDKCGNKATTDYTFIKDGTAPRIVLSGVGNYDKTDKNVELILTIDEDFYTSNKVTLKGTRTDIDGKKNEITFDDFAPNRSKVSELKQLFDKDGIYDIEVTSVDKAGNKSTKNVHFTIDKTPPKIGDLSKYDKKMLREFKWDIDLNKLVTDLTVCEITLYLDGVEYDGVSPIEDGSHVLKVEAVDEMGHKSSKEVTFVLDSKGPNIIVSNVEDQDVFYEAKDIGVSVQLDEDMLDEVQLNGSAVTVTDNQATMKIDKKGDYTLTAKAHDEAGNESSISIKFTFGSEMNIWMIIGIAGGIILLLLILLLIIRKKRSW